MEDDELNTKINECYKRYYMKYHGINLKKKKVPHYFGNKT